ncbi:sensor histidine kinase, partial [Micromonospora sp. MW-13]|uniref:sensor histidine kinase n=1 Tax=Micromonospora sp. MW-13 TaxID=2094022 RepID=UPI000FFF3DA6
ATVVLSAVVAALGSVLVAVDLALSHRLVRAVAGRSRRVSLGVLVLAAALAVVILLPDTGSAVSIAAIPLAWALRAIAGGSFWSGIARLFGATAFCAIITAALATGTGAEWNRLTLGVAALLALGVLGQDSIYTLAIELDDLRGLEAERAVATERKRFAGDLHDIQGQHLGLITVEAELVTRLIATERYGAAAQHAQRVQTIAADALDELHRVVHAYREVTLTEEIANAARVLEAASITVTRTVKHIGQLTGEQDRLLGLTVREAITNILKHTRAASCIIDVTASTRGGRDGVQLVVSDSGPAALHIVRSPGTGLATLRERYRAAGGEFSFVATNGATLTAWLPVEEGILP